MSKNKLERFAEMKTFENVYQNFSFKNPKIEGKGGEHYDFKGSWATDCFGNDNPVILELACGGGEYTVGLAEMFPEKNFIGLDIKGARIYKGAKYALNNDIKNAAFLRTRIELISKFFAEQEVSEIWITFPDPFPKDSDENNRLTSPIFLDRYLPLLEHKGLLHLKTDSLSLYEYSLEVFRNRSDIAITENDSDIYSHELNHDELEIKTYYEERHLQNDKTIKYIRSEHRK